jgi:hypothetical protein
MIEITRFRLRPGVSDDEFREADARYQTQFIYQQPGIVRRTTAQGEGGEWLVIDLWRSRPEANASVRRRKDDPSVQAYLALVDESTIRASRYDELEG